MMKHSTPLMLFVMVVLAALCSSSSSSSSAASEQQPAADQQGGLRKLVKLPDLIDFERFQQIYHKHYPSLLEKLARAKLFAANLFRVFVSCVNFIWRRSPKYLAVNRWSDSTVEERRKFFNYGGERLKKLMMMNGEETKKREPELAADPRDVERKLEEIVEHKEDNELYSEIAAELEEEESATRRRRKKRDTGDLQADSHHISWEELMRIPDNSFDFGGAPAESMPADEAKEIVDESDDGWFTSVLKSAASRAAEAIAKYSPLEGRSDPAEGKKWIIHSRPRSGLNDTYDRILFDHNDSHCMAPIQDQGLCGCCYAMAATALFEYHYCTQRDTFVPFSKQYAIDCGPQYQRDHWFPGSLELNGCHGGREDHVAEFFASYGIEIESEYPFRQREGECPVSSTESARKRAKIFAKDTEWKWMDPHALTNEQIKFHLETKGPMAISTYVYDDLFFYGGGVDMLDKCNQEGGHAWNMIGYGIEDGLEYWLIRNSMGEAWGARGHWKLSMTARDCLMRIGYATPKFIHPNEVDDAEHSASITPEPMSPPPELIYSFYYE